MQLISLRKNSSRLLLYIPCETVCTRTTFNWAPSRTGFVLLKTRSATEEHESSEYFTKRN